MVKIERRCASLLWEAHWVQVDQSEAKVASGTRLLGCPRAALVAETFAPTLQGGFAKEVRRFATALLAGQNFRGVTTTEAAEGSVGLTPVAGTTRTVRRPLHSRRMRVRCMPHARYMRDGLRVGVSKWCDA